VRSWPIAPWKVFLATLLPETLLVSVMITLGVAGVAIYRQDPDPRLALLVAVVPLAVLVWTSIDNATFLFAPVRTNAAQDGALQNAGRAMMLMLMRMIGLALALGLAVIPYANRRLRARAAERRRRGRRHPRGPSDRAGRSWAAGARRRCRAAAFRRRARHALSRGCARMPGAMEEATSTSGLASYAELRTAIEAIDDGLVVHEADGRISQWNSAALRILGLSAEQLLGKTPLDPSWRSIHPDGRHFPGEEHPASVTLRTGKPLTNVLMGIERAGRSTVWLAITSRLLPTTPAHARATVVTFRDITREREALAELRSREALLHATLDSLPAGLFVATPAIGACCATTGLWLRFWDSGSASGRSMRAHSTRASSPRTCARSCRIRRPSTSSSRGPWPVTTSRRRPSFRCATGACCATRCAACATSSAPRSGNCT
jgi:PAS domain S-box-containing protein